MPEAEPRQLAGRTLLTAAAFVVIVAGLRAAADLLVPFLVAVFIALISLPLLNLLQRWRVPTPIAVLLTVATVIAFIWVGLSLLGGSIRDFTEAAPRYQVRLQALAVDGLEWLRGHGIDLSRELVNELINPGVAIDLVTGTLRGVAAVLSRTFIVLLVVVLILFEAAGFPRKFEAAFGKREASERYHRIREDVQRYIGIKTLVSMVTGVLAGSAMAMLGIDFPVLWGVLAFALNYIPNLGSILAAIPPVLLAIVQYGPGRAIAVAAVFVTINITLGNFTEPYLLGRRLGLSTLVVVLSLVFWGWVWGPIGMLLSVPLTMIIKIMLEHTEDMRWVAVLLDASPSTSTLSESAE